MTIDSKTHYEHGVALVQQEDYIGALSAFRKAQRAAESEGNDPVELRSRFQCARVLYQDGKKRYAVAELRTLQALVEENTAEYHCITQQIIEIESEM